MLAIDRPAIKIATKGLKPIVRLRGRGFLKFYLKLFKCLFKFWQQFAIRVMLFLMLDVVNDFVHILTAHRLRTVTALPFEITRRV